jgi:hypothetical protein
LYITKKKELLSKKILYEGKFNTILIEVLQNFKCVTSDTGKQHMQNFLSSKCCIMTILGKYVGGGSCIFQNLKIQFTEK